MILILGLFVFGIIFYFKPNKSLDKTISIDKILVTKHKRKLDLISNGQIVKSYKISLGCVPKGAKRYEGEKKLLKDYIS